MAKQYTFRVRSGFHVARDAKGNRVQVGKNETFEDDRPLHKGVLGDKLILVKDRGEEAPLVEDAPAPPSENTPTPEPIQTQEPVLESDEDEDDLNEMTVAELKEYAGELELDASGCRVKQDYITLIKEALKD